MTTTIDVRLLRRIEVPDELVVFSEHFRKQGVERIDATATLKALAGIEPDEIVEASVVGTIVVAPDPDQLVDYEASVAELAERTAERDAKRLVGAVDLPTDEELAEQYPLEDPPAQVPMCSLCGSTEFRYDESRYEYSGMDETKSDDNGTVIIFSGCRTGDGDGWPGVVCEGCEAVMDVPGTVEIEWGF